MEDYYTIQTPDHGSSMLTEMHILQKQGVMCDVILAAEDGEVMAHKVVLMAASKFFREKLSPVVSQSAAKVCLKGISVVELANLIKYIYSGKLLVAKDTMDITLEISEILELNGVIQGYNEIVSKEAGQDQLTNKNSDDVQTKTGFPVSNENTGTNNIGLKIPVQNPVKIEANSPNECPTGSKETHTCDYSFQLQNPYQEQYVDVSVGSKSPSEAIPAASAVQNGNQPKGAVSNKISEEESEHQDLLAVAIESLSDTSNMMSHQSKTAAELDAGVVVEKQFDDSENKVEDIDGTLKVTSFVNGRTSTKTVTLNAGVVSNEFGGHTEVYTVSLDPESLKAPIQMPRPMRKRTDKEKKAQETARKYRRRKNEVLNCNLPEQFTDKPQVSLGTESTKEIDPKSGGTLSDFQYASLSKEKKKNDDMPTKLVHVLVSGKESSDEVVPSFNLNSESSNEPYYQILLNNAMENIVEVHTNPAVAALPPTKHTESESKEASGSAKTLIKHNRRESPKTPSTDEDNRSSATKRKTRTPKRLPWSEGEAVDESDVRACIPVVRTRRNSKLESKPHSTDKMLPVREMEQDSEKQNIENVPHHMLPHVRLERHDESSVVTNQKQAVKVAGTKSNDSQVKCNVEMETSNGTKDNIENEENKLSMQDMEISWRGRKRKSLVKPGFEYSLPVSSKKKQYSFKCDFAGCNKEFRNLPLLKSHRKKCKFTNDGDDSAVDKSNSENMDATEKETNIENKNSEEMDSAQSCCSDIIEAAVENVINPVPSQAVEAACNTEDTLAEQDHDESDPDSSSCKSAEETDRPYTCFACDFQNVSIDVMDDHISTHKDGKVKCICCAEEFTKHSKWLQHEEFKHTGRRYSCSAPGCNFSTNFKHSLRTHQNIKHTDTSQRLLNCQHCGYQTPLSGNLRKHMQGVHKLVVIRKELQKQSKFQSFKIGQVVTVDGQLFDSTTMIPPASRRVHSNKDTDCKTLLGKKVDARRSRFSLKNLPVEEFTKEILRRHHAYVNAPEKVFDFMTPVLAKSTLLPSFPQASPNVRNSKANKLYNMPKISPKYTPLNQSVQGWVPIVVKEVEVTQQRGGYGDIVIENVESGVPYRPGSTVLKLVEKRDPADNEQMIMITSNGVQSIVRSQDFYETLLESGHESSETLKVISSLLEAGEEIEIREEGETVEIQNI